MSSPIFCLGRGSSASMPGKLAKGSGKKKSPGRAPASLQQSASGGRVTGLRPNDLLRFRWALARAPRARNPAENAAVAASGFPACRTPPGLTLLHECLSGDPFQIRVIELVEIWLGQPEFVEDPQRLADIHRALFRIERA